MNHTGSRNNVFTSHRFATAVTILMGTLLMIFSLASCENQRDVPDMGSQQSPGSQGLPGQTQPGQNHPGNPSGAGSGSQQTTQPPAPQPQKLSFQLPKGWEWHEEITNKARSDHHSHDGVKPYVLFQLYDMGTGTETDAEKNAKSDHEQRLLWCKPEECAKTLKYYVQKVAGYNLYVSADTGDYWGKNSWYSSIAFVKDGHVFDIELDDLPENEPQALQMALQTLTLK